VLFRIASFAALMVHLTSVVLPAHAQFETRASFFISGSSDPRFLVVDDFNRDGRPDVAVVNVVKNTSGNVEILLGNGDGTFRVGATYPFTAPATTAFAGSLRDNGIVDLVVGAAGADVVYVLLGNGDGTFQPPISYPTTAESRMIALGDFMGQGHLDIVDTEGTSVLGVVCDCVEILPGNGDGTFGAPITTPVPDNVEGVEIATGDFNDDGRLDVAVGGGIGIAGQVDIFLGNGNGTFNLADFYQLGQSNPNGMAAGYFTSDKTKLDLVAGTFPVSVLLGDGDGTFQPPSFYGAGGTSWVIAQDLNGDGKLDLAVSDSGSPPQFPPGVSVLNGNGDGTFQNAVFYPVGAEEGGQFVAAGDFNGDHKPDLLVLDSVHGYIWTLLNTGVVSFSPTTPLNFKKQTVGTTSPPQMVSLTNTGSKAVRIASMKASAEFGVTSNCGASVAAGAKCSISVTFSPIQKGAKQGTITIIDSASAKPQVIEVLGTGT
jgi:hypothetical protein